MSQIMQTEDKNPGNKIYLWTEGNFYHAYNRSAWLACLTMKDFKVVKKMVEKT